MASEIPKQKIIYLNNDNDDLGWRWSLSLTAKNSILEFSWLFLNINDQKYIWGQGKEVHKW
jgi:hypothetical protein